MSVISNGKVYSVWITVKHSMAEPWGQRVKRKKIMRAGRLKLRLTAACGSLSRSETHSVDTGLQPKYGTGVSSPAASSWSKVIIQFIAVQSDVSWNYRAKCKLNPDHKDSHPQRFPHAAPNQNT